MQAMLATLKANDLSQFDTDAILEDLSDTLTLKAALTGPEKDQWVHAIHSELDNIKSEDVYDLVDPKTENIENLLGNKIVLHQKCGATGKIEWYKACSTAQGDHQHESIYFDETFAPIVKSASLRVFFSLCAKLSYKMQHMDITSAFLNGGSQWDCLHASTKRVWGAWKGRLGMET